jgi:peptidoglycan/LPS O-acetylase OafA/YrhL
MVKAVSKVAYLDGIRGVAAFLVFFHHFLLVFFSAFYSFDVHATNLNGWDVRYGQSVFSVLSNGHFFVCIFFVLSGFVLSRKYYQSNDLTVVLSGAHRRFLRLYIPVASTIIISFLMLKAGFFYNVPVSSLRHSEWWFGTQWNIPQPLLQLWICLKYTALFQGDSSFDTSLWTMSIEFFGSFFVFGFLAFTHNTNRKLFVLFLILLYFKFTEQPNMANFVFGISLNYLEKLAPKFSRNVVNITVIILVLAGLFLGSYPSSNYHGGTIFEKFTPFFLKYSRWYHSIGAFCIVAAVMLSPFLQKLFSLKPVRFLGHISFSLYLLHPLVLGSFSSWLYLKLAAPVGFNKSLPLIFILTALVCLIVAWLMTKFIDEPGVKFSKYVYSRWFKKAPVVDFSPENKIE